MGYLDSCRRRTSRSLNRNSIYVFVNRRLIRDRVVLKAITSAYHNVIPPGTFPFALLFIDIPFEDVDVNVHPRRPRCSFRRQSFVHDFVRDSIRDLLVASKPVSSIPCPGPRDNWRLGCLFRRRPRGSSRRRPLRKTRRGPCWSSGDAAANTAIAVAGCRARCRRSRPGAGLPRSRSGCAQRASGRTSSSTAARR